MIRALVVAALLAGCAACTDTASSDKAWYQSGDATYDALKTAADACKAKGGDFHVKRGGDPTQLSDFQCVGMKGS
jgi:ABC-type glycerol-3-phosphate transport system substrate-binding protein